MKPFLTILLCFFLLGCETIRMKYESTVQVQDQPTLQKFTYVNSYPVGGAFPTLCWISGIALGGSCWYYLAMPSVQQKSLIAEDARDYLAKKYPGKSFEEDQIKVSRVSFNEGGEEAQLAPKERPHSDHPTAP